VTWDRAPEAESSQVPRSVDRAGGGVLSRSSICVTTSGRVLVIGWSRRTYSRALRSRKPPASVGGWLPGERLGHCDGEGVPVAFGGSLCSAVAELGCCVGIGAARDAGRVGESGKAEIDQDGSAACLDDDVGGLDVAVGDGHLGATTGVHLVERGGNGAEHAQPLRSRRVGMLIAPFPQRATFDIVHHDVAVDYVRLRCGTSAMHGRPVEKVDDAHQPGVGQALQ
jgi:hypothetical protein